MPVDKLQEFQPIFYPQSMAVVGASASERKPGNQFFRALREFGFKGRLYPVNPEESEILGVKTYPGVRDIPEPVDLVNISTPARVVPQVMRDCVARGVHAVEIFSAGFSELDDEGRRLEEEIVGLTKGKLRIIGPNCFGVYCPRGGLTLLPGAKYPKKSGDIAIISQSGGSATDFIWAASGYGLSFSKVISYGNACDLNEADFLEYLAADPETNIIAAYIEGVKDAKRFFQLAKGLRGTKPLIIWKGGLTQTGNRAVHSHTASLAGQQTTWQAFFKQSDAVMTHTLEEFMDTIAAFAYFPHHPGQRVAVVGGGGGGAGVSASDTCERAGLTVPITPAEIQEQLRALLPPTGASFRNPVDVGSPFPEPSAFRKVLEILLSWNSIDAVIVDRIFFYDTQSLTGIPRAATTECASVLTEMKSKTRKPILAVLGELSSDADMIDVEADRRRLHRRFLQAGIFVLPSLYRAATALANMCFHYQRTSLVQAEGDHDTELERRKATA